MDQPIHIAEGGAEIGAAEAPDLKVFTELLQLLSGMDNRVHLHPGVRLNDAEVGVGKEQFLRGEHRTGLLQKALNDAVGAGIRGINDNDKVPYLSALPVFQGLNQGNIAVEL